jgi:adenine deaminase
VPESGLSAEEALAAATWVAGDSLGVEGLGRIEVGAPADLLVLREDPTRDLRALRTIEAVIADGRLYRIDELRAALAAQRRYLECPVVALPLRAVARAGFQAARRGSRDGG